jgi:hypothetical protein
MKASSEVFPRGYPALASPTPACHWPVSSGTRDLPIPPRRRARIRPDAANYGYAAPWAQAVASGDLACRRRRVRPSSRDPIESIVAVRRSSTPSR